MTVEDAADDGAAHQFWAFIIRRRLAGRPEFDLDAVAGMRAAVAEFEREPWA
jgi:hypothetical protein